MKIVSTSEMRELDRRMIESGVSGEELMQVAGEGLAAALRRLAAEHQLENAPVLFVAGCGNNGGDAFVAARILHEDGGLAECWLAGSEEKLQGAALAHFRQMKQAGVPFQALEDSDAWRHAEASGSDAEIVVDGLLGTGASGAPRGVVADAVDFINAQNPYALVVAIDVPSARAVHADLTVAMGLPKEDNVLPENIDFTGNLEVVDLGFPDELVDEAQGFAGQAFIHPADLVSLFPRRARDAHKGTYGRVLCVGGSKGFSGAITLAARAAVRSGAGLVSACVPEEIHALVAPALPEVMVHSDLPEGDWSAIVAGPGLGRTDAARKRIVRLLAESTASIVLDADAITVLAGRIEALAETGCPLVLTPHPGEFATLFGLKPGEVQEDRAGMARMAADRLGCTVVLKGAGTLVAAPARPVAINLTGNPGMASGGSGDVLSGIVGGLVAQGLAPYDAACAAVWLHGRAGDLAAAEKSQVSLIPPDLIDRLPDAFRDICCR